MAAQWLPRGVTLLRPRSSRLLAPKMRSGLTAARRHSFILLSAFMRIQSPRRSPVILKSQSSLVKVLVAPVFMVDRLATSPVKACGIAASIRKEFSSSGAKPPSA